MKIYVCIQRKSLCKQKFHGNFIIAFTCNLTWHSKMFNNLIGLNVMCLQECLLLLETRWFSMVYNVTFGPFNLKSYHLTFVTTLHFQHIKFNQASTFPNKNHISLEHCAFYWVVFCTKFWFWHNVENFSCFWLLLHNWGLKPVRFLLESDRL